MGYRYKKYGRLFITNHLPLTTIKNNNYAQSIINYLLDNQTLYKNIYYLIDNYQFDLLFLIFFILIKLTKGIGNTLFLFAFPLS